MYHLCLIMLRSASMKQTSWWRAGSAEYKKSWLCSRCAAPLPPQIWTFSSLYSPILLYFCPLACFLIWIIVHAHLYMFLVYSSIRRPCRQKNYVLCFVIVFVKILSAIYLASTTFLLALTTFLWYIHGRGNWVYPIEKMSILTGKIHSTHFPFSVYRKFLFSIPFTKNGYTEFSSINPLVNIY